MSPLSERLQELVSDYASVDTSGFSWQLRFLPKYQLLYVFANEQNHALATHEWLKLVAKLDNTLHQLSQAVENNLFSVQWTNDSIEKRGVPIVNSERLVAMVHFVKHSKPDAQSSAKFVNLLNMMPSLSDDLPQVLPQSLLTALQLVATLDWFAGIIDLDLRIFSRFDEQLSCSESGHSS